MKPIPTRPILCSLLISLVAACGGSDKGGDTNHTKKVETEGDMHAAGGATMDCEQEITLVCPEGSVDGCGVTNDAGESLTFWHVCLPASETFSASNCEQEIARECDDGLVDACLLTPAASTVHVCVAKVVAGDDESSPEEDSSPDAPSDPEEPTSSPDAPTASE
jgi:hypothetical protein